MTSPVKPRILGALHGDISEAEASVKYGYFFNSLARKFDLIQVKDVHLHGAHRWKNLLLSFYPEKAKWQMRFYKFPGAFVDRSIAFGQYLRRNRNAFDMVLQVGVLFNASYDAPFIKNLIYTDYTSVLSAQKPASGRSPFSGAELTRWIALERQAYEQADHVFTRSRLVQASLIDDYGIAPAKVTVVGGGINFPPLPPFPAGNLEFGVPTGLFIGREFYRKGGDVLLKAFALARETYPDTHLLVVTRDEPAPDLPSENVHFIEYRWSRELLQSLYRMADYFVLPSRLETWGDVLLEAMAFGMPCIGTESDAMNEIILNKTNGCLVPVDNVDALSQSILGMVTNPERLKRWGENARCHVEENFTWDSVVGRMSSTIYKTAS